MAVAAVFGILGKISGITAGTFVFSIIAVLILKLVFDFAYIPKWLKKCAQVLSGCYLGSTILMEVKMSNISLKNISTQHCLNNVNLDIDTGELVIVLGYTGAGKSTLLNVIAGLTEYSGEVYFDHKNMFSLGEPFGKLTADVVCFLRRDLSGNKRLP